MVRLYAANHSKHEWRVSVERGHVCAQLTSVKLSGQHERPAIDGASSFARVDDGWLVGFNHGEWGGALYWYSPDGKNKYKVSDHQIVDFFSLPNGIHAIEGMAHLSINRGSIIRIARSEPHSHWKAITVTSLFAKPYAISMHRDNAMLITLSNSLISVDTDYNISILLHDPPWGNLFPNSSVLSSDQQKLYIGMRQFVGEFDIPTKKVRLLIPSGAFLHKLSKKEEREIRKQLRQ